STAECAYPAGSARSRELRFVEGLDLVLPPGQVIRTRNVREIAIGDRRGPRRHELGLGFRDRDMGRHIALLTSLTIYGQTGQNQGGPYASPAFTLSGVSGR